MTASASDHGSQALRRLLEALAPLPEAEWAWLEPTLAPRRFAVGAPLFQPGQQDAGIHFLRSGLVRYFYLTEDGRERNHTFAAAGSLVGCLPAFVGAGPCTFTVEALEPAATLLIVADAARALADRHECWVRLKLRLMEHVALRKEAREAEFLLDSAETRYRRFLSQYRSLAGRIPQYHIASYLGITPVALSRIRRRVNPS
jgi:CRP-like cAMP-binding protein